MKKTAILFVAFIMLTAVSCNKCYTCTSPALSGPSGNEKVEICKGDQYYNNAKSGDNTFLGQGTTCVDK